MKAVQVAMFFLCINAAFFIVDATDVWAADDVGGASPQDVENNIVLENAQGMPSGLTRFVGSRLTMGVILAGILIGGATTLAARVTTPQVVGILAFVIIYSVLLGNLTGLLQDMMLPSSLITVLTGFQYFWMTMAVIQMATGTSFKVMQ